MGSKLPAVRTSRYNLSIDHEKFANALTRT